MTAGVDAARARDRGAEGTEAVETTASDILALLEDEHVREILRALAGEPMTASAIAAACDCSRPTVYRRLKRLSAAGLVATSISIDADGHHRKLFCGRLDGVTVDLDADGWSVTVETIKPPSNQ